MTHFLRNANIICDAAAAKPSVIMYSSTKKSILTTFLLKPHLLFMNVLHSSLPGGVIARLDLFKKLGMIWKDRRDSLSIIRENLRDKPVRNPRDS